jgi:hypothetical protein
MVMSDVGRRSVASVAILSLLWPAAGAGVIAQGTPAAAPDPAAAVDVEGRGRT